MSETPTYIRVPDLLPLTSFVEKLEAMVAKLRHLVTLPETDEKNKERMFEQVDFIEGFIHRYRFYAPRCELNTNNISDLNAIYHVYVMLHKYLKSFNVENLNAGAKSGHTFCVDVIRGTGISHLYG